MNNQFNNVNTVFLTIVVIVVMTASAMSAKRAIRIGAVFDRTRDGHDLHKVLQLATKRLNANTNVRYEAVVRHVSEADSFAAKRAVCDLIERDMVHLVFGPQSLVTSAVVRSVADRLQIPFFASVPDATDSDLDAAHFSTVLNLHPKLEEFALALQSLITQMRWKSYTLVYETMENLVLLKSVLAIHKFDHLPVAVKQLKANSDYRILLKEIYASGESNIILACGTEKLIEILKLAKQVQMLQDYHSYVLVSLDAHTLNYTEIQTYGSNITTLRLIDPASAEMQQVLSTLLYYDDTKSTGQSWLTAKSVTVAQALLFDSLQLYSMVLNEMDLFEELNNERISCQSNRVSALGQEIVRNMKSKVIKGVSGEVKFDDNGQRINSRFQIVELYADGYKETGNWDSNRGIVFTRSEQELYSKIVENIHKKQFRVASRLGAPYLMFKKPLTAVGTAGNTESITTNNLLMQSLKGNDRFEGYVIDLIDEIAKTLNLTYEFYLVPDGQYGSYNPKTKQWNGLIRELILRNADLAVCDLTITYERRAAVDFTMPFMTLGISILYSKPVKQPPELFSFSHPLSFDVWMYTATAYMLVTLTLVVLSRMSSKEWQNTHPCDLQSNTLENIWNFNNCFWLMLGSVMAQGSDILPKILCAYIYAGVILYKRKSKIEKKYVINLLTSKNVSVTNEVFSVALLNIAYRYFTVSPFVTRSYPIRLVTSAWWAFSLIMLSTYTANLAAFLTMERMDSTIASVADLAEQSKVKYGTVIGGSTMNFFKKSNHTMYQRIWTTMESTTPSVFTKNNQEGIERVLRSKRNYAFFMESTSIEHAVERYCDLEQVGDMLDSKGYGIAMPMNSPYRTAISGAVLKLQEEGKLYSLKKKWWTEMYNKGKCKENFKVETSQNELGYANVAGVFVVLYFGIGIAFCLAIFEFLWNVRKVAVEEKITPYEALLVELKFACQFYKTIKPARPEISSSSSSSAMSLRSSSNSSAQSTVLKSSNLTKNILKSANSLLKIHSATSCTSLPSLPPHLVPTTVETSAILTRQKTQLHSANQT